jgi:hypothetical protein
MSGFDFPTAISAFWRGVLTATSQAAARTALGIADFASPGPIGATTPNTGRFTNLSGIVRTSQAVGGEFSIDGGIIDRFAFADRRGILTTTGVTSPANAVSKNSGTISFCPTGGQGVFEFIFPTPLTYAVGVIYGVLQNAASYQISILAGSLSVPTWTDYLTVNTETPHSMRFVVPGVLYLHRVRITITSLPGLQGRAFTLGYLPQRPDAIEKQQFLPLGDATAIDAFTPTFRVRNGTAIGELKPNAVEIRSSTGSTRWRIQVNDSGVITTTSI